MGARRARYTQCGRHMKLEAASEVKRGRRGGVDIRILKASSYAACSVSSRKLLRGCEQGIKFDFPLLIAYSGCGGNNRSVHVEAGGR